MNIVKMDLITYKVLVFVSIKTKNISFMAYGDGGD